MQNGVGGPDASLGATANYTLPGIMQYLQSQFTQVERNRLQGELERSSLKLKIIELENERNSLLRKNERLESTVTELNRELNQLKGVDNVNGGDSLNTKKIDDHEIDDSLEKMQSLDVSKLVRARKFLKSATNEILYLLKTPTIELDHTTSIGSATGLPSLTGVDNENDMFFNYSVLNEKNFARKNETQNNEMHMVTNKEENSGSAKMSNDNSHNYNGEKFTNEDIERDLNAILTASVDVGEDSGFVESDTETIIEEPISIKHDEKDDDDEDDDDEDDEDDDDFDDDEFDDDDDDDDDDEEDDVEEDETDAKGDNDYGDNVINKAIVGKKIKSSSKSESKNNKEKLFKLLKKSSKENNNEVHSTMSVQLTPNLSEMDVKNGKMFIYHDQENVVRVYDDLLGKGNLIKEVNLPEAQSIVDIITNEKFIIIATKNSLIAYTIDSNDDHPAIIKSDINFKSIDLEQDKILLFSETSIEILRINLADKKFDLISSVKYEYEGILKKAKFVRNNPTYDFSILSSNTLYLYSFDVKTELKLLKTVPLSQYHEWLLTSRNLILRFDQGLYLFDFKDCSEFKNVPLPTSSDSDQESNSISETIGTCVDDDTMFYVSRFNINLSTDKSSQIHEVRLFKVDSIGSIQEIKKLTNIRHEDCYCVGKLSTGFAICVAKGGKVEVYNVDP